MYMAQRTRQKIGIGLLAAAIYVGVVAALALFFPGPERVGVAFAKWFLGIPLGLAVYVALEWGGDKLLSLPLWSKMPAAARVLLLAFLVTLIAVAVLAIESWWHAQSTP
jgi:hypothetical protein